MTLGKKLSNYRKLSGMTQQQLGERLNLSAQAISKWENDLAEPDLSTLRALAELYKVSIDELLDLNAGIDGGRTYDADTVNEVLSGLKPPLGYCKECGVAVNEDNLGGRVPVLICRSCVSRREREAREAKAAAEKREKAAKEEQAREVRRKQASVRDRRTKSLVVAGIIAGIVLAVMIGVLTSEFSVAMLAVAIALPLFTFTFVSTMFFDCLTLDIMEKIGPAAIRWPGLIFTFDLDGFLWLIGMKLLFAVIGFVVGVVGSILAFVAAVLVSPFVFIYVMVKLHDSIANGEECELIN